MSAMELLIISLVVIGAAITAVLVTVIVSSQVEAHRIRIEPVLGDARRSIVTALSGGESEFDAACVSLSRLSERQVIAVLLDLAPSVSGASRSILVTLGERTGVLKRARSGVTRRRWFTRLYSARVLTAFGVESEELCRLLSDRSSEVRSQAAAWSVVAPNPESIERLIGLLRDPDGLCRFAAQDALIRIGLPASDALMGALDTDDGEVVRRVLEIAAAMGDARFYRHAMSLTSDPAPATRALAVAVLARTADPHAGPALVALLDDQSEVVVLAAATGIATLAYWPGATKIEPLLGHPSWELRKQAGLSLLALGAPGAIMLRTTAPGDGLAGEMAVQALQLRSISIRSDAA
jgi:HEAT repeat protein